MKAILTISLICLVICSSQAQSIKDLDFLIGDWEVSEVVFPGKPNEYIEKGARTCAYYLRGSYIKCETTAVRKGKDRSYTFLYSYDPDKEHFRLIKLSSDFPSYSVKSWKIDQAASLIREEDLGGYQFVSSISFEDKDRVIWKGWSPKIDKESTMQLIFEEVAIRK